MVLSMDKWVGKIAIVTGASSGIGAAIADGLVENGLIVVGVARRSELITQKSKTLADKKGKLHAFKADLSKEEDILNLFEWTSSNLGPVHILVNNAGKTTRALLTEGTSESWKSTFDLNVFALCIATREAVKIMRESKINGHIVHINSVLGHTIVNIPKLDVYPATKFAVRALTETLRQELKRCGLQIKVTSISPGLVESEMTTSNKNYTQEHINLLGQLPILKPEDVADGVIYALSTPQHVQVDELIIKPVGETVISVLENI